MAKTKKRNNNKNIKVTKKKTNCGCKYGGTNTDIDYPTVGTVVDARWRKPGSASAKKWNRGKITNVHPGRTSARNPSFDVIYDDGASEDKVKWKNIRVVNAPSHVDMGPPEPRYPPKKIARLPDLQTAEEYFLEVTGHDKDVVDALFNISKNKPKKKIEMPPYNHKLIGGLEPIIHNHDEFEDDQKKLFNFLMGFTGMMAISATAIAYSLRDLIM